MVWPDYYIEAKQEESLSTQQAEPKGSMKPFLTLPCPMSDGRASVPVLRLGLVAAPFHVRDELGQVIKKLPGLLSNLAETLEAVSILGAPSIPACAGHWCQTL